MPSYYIYRDGAANEPFDPTAPLQFFPPKDSDELFFALRQAYPNVSTHSERMRNAVIEFLMAEGETQRTSPQQSPTVTLEQSMTSSSTSPYSPYISLTSSASSSSDSPCLFDSQSPQQVTSPSAASAGGESSRTAAARANPDLEQMTSVFSLSSHSQPKLRSRRKMTEAEKVEYRKMRSAGACKQCSSRKRKCIHNGDTQTDSSSSNKRVAKAKTQKTRGKRPQSDLSVSGLHTASAPPPPTRPSLDQFAPLDTGDQALLDLFSFEDPSLGNWQTDADRTLLDMSPADFAFMHTHSPFIGINSRPVNAQYTSHTTRDSNSGSDTDLGPQTPFIGVNPRPVDTQYPSHLTRNSGAGGDGIGAGDFDLFDSSYASAPFGVSASTTNSMGHMESFFSPYQAPSESHDSQDLAGSHYYAENRSLPLGGVYQISPRNSLQVIPQHNSIDLMLSSDLGNDPVAAASIKERQSLTLCDSGQVIPSREMLGSGASVRSATAGDIASPGLPRAIATSAQAAMPSPRVRLQVAPPGWQSSRAVETSSGLQALQKEPRTLQVRKGDALEQRIVSRARSQLQVSPSRTTPAVLSSSALATVLSTKVQAPASSRAELPLLVPTSVPTSTAKSPSLSSPSASAAITASSSTSSPSTTLTRSSSATASSLARPSLLSSTTSASSSVSSRTSSSASPSCLAAVLPSVAGSSWPASSTEQNSLLLCQTFLRLVAQTQTTILRTIGDVVSADVHALRNSHSSCPPTDVQGAMLHIATQQLVAPV